MIPDYLFGNIMQSPIPTYLPIMLVYIRWSEMKVLEMLDCLICTEISYIYIINVGPSAKIYPG